VKRPHSLNSTKRNQICHFDQRHKRSAVPKGEIYFSFLSMTPLGWHPFPRNNYQMSNIKNLKSHWKTKRCSISNIQCRILKWIFVFCILRIQKLTCQSSILNIIRRDAIPPMQGFHSTSKKNRDDMATYISKNPGMASLSPHF